MHTLPTVHRYCYAALTRALLGTDRHHRHRAAPFLWNQLQLQEALLCALNVSSRLVDLINRNNDWHLSSLRVEGLGRGAWRDVIQAGSCWCY